MSDEGPEAALPAWRRGLDHLVGADLVLSELIMVAMMMLVTAEVILRSTIGFSFQFTDEVASYLLVAITFLGFGIALHDEALFRVEFLYDRIPYRPRQVLQLFFNLGALGFSLILDHQLIRLVVSSYTRDNIAPTLIATPLFIPQLVMPIGVTFMILLLLAAIVGNFASITGRGPESGRTP